jgi:hypothetical protein
MAIVTLHASRMFLLARAGLIRIFSSNSYALCFARARGAAFNPAPRAGSRPVHRMNKRGMRCRVYSWGARVTPPRRHRRSPHRVAAVHARYLVLWFRSERRPPSGSFDSLDAALAHIAAHPDSPSGGVWDRRRRRWAA